MCGIFGYAGKPGANEVILNGLKRLEYRGYDSWGIAVKHNGTLETKKDIGAIGDIDLAGQKSRACIGIGHTRWATHGNVTKTNAHPHKASDGSFVLAQNGIVENCQDLKTLLLKKGHVFKTQTDTEVIVRLIEEKRKTEKSLLNATRTAFLELKGRNTIIVLASETDQLIAVRNGSPLVVGVGNDEYFISSDTLSFADRTNKVILLKDFQMVNYEGGSLSLYDVSTGKKLQPHISILDQKSLAIDKEGYDHYMIKEIIEQKDTIREAIQYTENDLLPLVNAIKDASTVYTVGAGTAGYAAGEIAYFLRKYGDTPAIELKSYETDSHRDLFGPKDILIAVSQSGETADTIEAIDIAKARGTTIASIVNMIGSTTSRLSEFAYLSRTGPEICVASTKAFTAQISWGLVLAHTVGESYAAGTKAVYETAEKLEGYFSDELLDYIASLAQKLKTNEHFFVLGKGANYYISLEGALKVKEITYKHFEGFAAGELKHGVIALIEKNTPIFVIVSEDEFKDDMLTAVAEVQSRGAWTIGIADQNNDLFDDHIPTINGGAADPITKVIPFQILSYYLGVALGNNIDRPRNLAKSVTVK